MIDSRSSLRGPMATGVAALTAGPVLLILTATGVTVALAALIGIANLDLAVKMAIVAIIVVAAAAAIMWKPVLFPLSAYLFMVPFDNLLQTGAGTVTKFLAAGSIAVMLLIMTDRRRTTTPPLATFTWLAFLLWSVASLWWTQTQAASFYWIQIVLSLYALYAVISLFRIKEREVRVLAGAVIGGGAACAAYGVWLFMQGTAVASNGVASRLSLSFGSTASINSDHFAGALVLPIALATVALQRQLGVRRWCALAALAILFAGLFISATRGAFIGVAVMWAYMILVSKVGRKTLLMLAGGALLASFAVPSVWLRFFDPSQGQAGGRFGIWSVAWEAFRRHWLVGVGVGDFRTAYSDAYLAVFQGTTFHAWAEDSHNLIASTTVELGIVGLVLMAAAWFFQFRTVAVIPRTSSLADLRLATEAGLLGLLTVSMTVDVFYYKYLWLGFMLAVLVRNAHVCETQAAAPPVTLLAEPARPD